MCIRDRQTVLRVEGGQLGELHPCLGLLRGHPVDGVEADQRVELGPVAGLTDGDLPFAQRLDGAGDGVTLTQTVSTNQAERDVDVPGAGEVARGADERVVVQHIELSLIHI